MTERHTVDTITSDVLDHLYQRAEQAEAAITRARDEADTIERGVAGIHDAAYVCRAAANRIRAALDGPVPSPCPSCRRADQAGLADTELHTVCTTKEPQP